MLNIRIKAGECIQIGDDIRVIIQGGIENQYKVMIDAPREYNVVRGKVLERNAASEEECAQLKQYYSKKPSKEEIQYYIEKRHAKKAEATTKSL